MNSNSFKMPDEDKKEGTASFICKVILSVTFCGIYGVYAFSNPDHPEERKDCFVEPQGSVCLDEGSKHATNIT